MTLLGSVGLTSTKGSTSELTKFVPGPPTVHAANGLGLEAFTGGSAVYVPATAAAPIARAPAASRAYKTRRMADLLPRKGNPRYASSGLHSSDSRRAMTHRGPPTRLGLDREEASPSSSGFGRRFTAAKKHRLLDKEGQSKSHGGHGQRLVTAYSRNSAGTPLSACVPRSSNRSRSRRRILDCATIARPPGCWCHRHAVEGYHAWIQAPALRGAAKLG